MQEGKPKIRELQETKPSVVMVRFEEKVEPKDAEIARTVIFR